MAKKKPARKSSKGKKKKAAPRKAARSKKSSAKKSPSGAKAKKAGKPVAMVEVAEIELIGEPEEAAADEEFPPDYGGSE